MFGEEGKSEGEETKAFENVWGRKSVPPLPLLKEYWAKRPTPSSSSSSSSWIRFPREISSGADEQRFNFDLFFVLQRGDGDGCGGFFLRDVIAGDLKVCDMQYRNRN